MLRLLPKLNQVDAAAKRGIEQGGGITVPWAPFADEVEASCLEALPPAFEYLPNPSLLDRYGLGNAFLGECDGCPAHW